MSPISYGNVFLVCFLFAMDQEAVAGVSPYGRDQSSERLADDITEGGHAALCEKCDDCIADQGGCADRKQNHQDVENDAQRRVRIRLEGDFAVEHKGDHQAEGEGADHRGDPADLPQDAAEVGHNQKDDAGIGDQQKIGFEFLDGHG